MLSGAAVPGPQCESGGRGVVRCRARPMRPLANPWTVLHDPWRFGYVFGEMRAMMCGMMCGSVAVRSEIVARVILIISRVRSLVRESYGQNSGVYWT